MDKPYDQAHSWSYVFCDLLPVNKIHQPSYPLGIDPIALFSYQSSLDIRKKTSDTAHLSSASESGSAASLLLKAVLNLNSEL